MTVNFYYDSAEATGLTKVAEIEWREPCYDFTLSVLWRDMDGRFYAASDSGCSCPTPFEDFSSRSKLTPINSLGELQQFLKSAQAEAYIDSEDEPRIAPQKAAFIRAYLDAKRTA